jgi:hypothetical protein
MRFRATVCFLLMSYFKGSGGGGDGDDDDDDDDDDIRQMAAAAYLSGMTVALSLPDPETSTQAH